MSTPLMLAAADGHKEGVLDLLDAGANINAQSSFGNTALHCAIQNGHPNIAEILIDAGTDLTLENKDFDTPLLTAMWCNESSVGVILASGFDPNTENSRGDRALFFARSGDTAKKLISAGADVNIADHCGNTPLMVACYNGHIDVAKELIHSGANINVTDSMNYSILHAAIYQRQHPNLKMIKFLLQTDIDLHIKSAHSLTAVGVIIQKRYLPKKSEALPFFDRKFFVTQIQ